MTKEKSKAREFNRLYKNLEEVCRRVYDTEKDYPKKACAEWFVNDLNTLLSDEELKAKLNDEGINHIAEMAKNLRATHYLDVAHKKLLTEMLKELKAMKTHVLGA